MSNIKEVRIEADVAFDWLTWNPHASQGLPAIDIAVIASALMSPSTGLTYEYSATVFSMQPNENGGLTAMYRLTIGGQEAVAWAFLERLIRTITASGPYAKIITAQARDIEDSQGNWENIIGA
jgi:hypothetical protein